MNGTAGLQRGFIILITVVLTLLFTLLGTYMLTLSNIAAFNASQSHRYVQAWFAAKSGVEWASHRVLHQNRGLCTCGTDCCAAPRPIHGVRLAFNSNADGAAGGFDVEVSCVETLVTEGSDSYCVYNLTARAQRGDQGSLNFVSRQISWLIADNR